jgi:hypothetical protein
MNRSMIAGLFPQKSGAGKVEPLRVLGGEMRGRAITGRLERVGQPTSFSFTIAKADIAQGRLRLNGSFSIGRLSEQASATINGIMAKAADPWPGPREEKKDQKAGERNEQTQSLYAQAETGTGCELMFCSLTLSPRLRARLGAGPTVQLGVVLDPFDNPRGEEINRQFCRILRSKPDSPEMTSAIERLNHLFASA